MKRSATIALLSASLFVSAIACKTPTPASNEGSETEEVAEQPAEETAAEPGPFEVAQAWLAAPDDHEVAEMVGGWSASHVERMHADGEDRYRVLAVGDGEDAALLTVERVDGEWTVIEVAVVKPDYLWPSR